ncbi:hypothetical protein [Effusibacillus pohliae]|uniref:hypothetical protein n=1 Tax=Effusibacillus pohliae TaxID=232270 RepID=UPI00035EC339|nr:hypothetical protein [Effusibacillus pohliae]
MRCPNCNCRDIGKIGTNQYYCWECFVEFSMIGEQVKLYQVEEDGSLSLFNDLSGSGTRVQQI